MQEKLKYFLNTKILGSEIIYHNEIESTQKEIRKMAENNIKNGTIVIADYQTDGIGTNDRVWLSEKGENITFSFVIYPRCKVNELEEITIDIAKCMIEAIHEISGNRLEIKEPNDIVYNGKKMGGILTQIVTIGENIKYLLIGIGINVNQIDFPDELKNIATSLKKEFGKEFSREEIIAKFCNKFENYCIEKNII